MLSAEKRRKINAENLKKIRRDLARVEDFKKFADIINKNGYKNIKVSTLLRYFSIQKRTDKNIKEINDFLVENKFFSDPEFSKELKLSSNIKFYNYPLKNLGDIFESEKKLEDYVFEKKLYKKLGIKTVTRQFPPVNTKDRIDFKGQDRDGKLVVLELKRTTGGKTAVEQVLRYTGHLRRQYPDKEIRSILVTGVQNFETALTIIGMHPQQRNAFEWYLYKYDCALDKFEFIRVTNKDIENQTSYKMT